MKKTAPPVLSNDEIRQMILQFFYYRAINATSLRGKKGSSLKMKDIKSGLKTKHGFKDNQIIGNLTYLLGQGWVKEEVEKKSFTTKGGVALNPETRYYSITPAGTDRIEGPSRFTPKRFDGINIEAIGSVVTIGDGNQINANFKNVAEALSELRNAVTQSAELNDNAKLDIVTDIDSIQDQLVKPNPNKSVIKTLWEGIHRTASVASLADLIAKVSPIIIPLFN